VPSAGCSGCGERSWTERDLSLGTGYTQMADHFGPGTGRLSATLEKPEDIRESIVKSGSNALVSTADGSLNL